MTALPRALLALAVAAFAAGMSSLAVLQQEAFHAGRFDVGNLTQTVWSTANGRLLEMTDMHGDQISRLGAHFDPIVVALVPLWLVWPSPDMLLVVQGVAVALGALPVYLLARKHLGGEWAGLGLSLLYLLYPPTQWLVVDDFHPVAFATPLLLGAIWFLDEERLLPFALCAAAACLTKEQVGLVVAMLGVWYAVAHGRRHAGAVIATAGAAIAIAVTTVVVPHFSPGSGSPFEGRYTAVGGSPAGMLRTAVTDPLRIVSESTQHVDLLYLLHLLAPLAGLPLLSPLMAAAALPDLALNLLSRTPTQTSIHFHYTAAEIPVLLAASVFGAAALRRRRAALWPLTARVAIVLVVLSGVMLGPLPVWRQIPNASTLATRDHLVTAHDRAAARVLRAVPAAVPVSATNTLGAHLSERRRVFSFPVLREARWVAVDLRRPSYLDDATGRQFGVAWRQLRRDGHWRVVREEDGVVVLHRP